MDTAFSSFDGGATDVAAHIAASGHNEWETLEPGTGRWARLGAYVGDGYFERFIPLSAQTVTKVTKPHGAAPKGEVLSLLSM